VARLVDEKRELLDRLMAVFTPEAPAIAVRMPAEESDAPTFDQPVEAAEELERLHQQAETELQDYAKRSNLPYEILRDA
jgi:hypothetical protein